MFSAARILGQRAKAAAIKAMVPKAPQSTAAVPAERYNGAMQFTHWAMGGAMTGCFATVQLAQQSKGKEKGKYMLYHKSLALIAVSLLPVRLGLRLASNLPKEVPGSFLEQTAARVVHYAMYGMMTFVPLSGVAMGYFGGKGLPFFGIFTIPGAKEKNGKIAGQAFKYHKLVGQVFEYTFLAHVGAVGAHRLLHGQNILARMLPFGKV